MTLAERTAQGAFDGVSALARSRIVKEFAWVGIGEVAGALGMIVGVRVLTDAMTPQAYGELALGLSLAALTGQVVIGPLGSAAERFFATATEHGQLADLFWTLRRWSLGASAVAVLVTVLLVVVLLAADARQWVAFVVAASAFAVLSGLERIVDGLQNAARARVVVAWHQALRQWLRPALAAVLIGVLPAQSGVALAGFALASVCVLVSQLLLFRAQMQGDRRGPVAVASRRFESRLLAYAAPFAMWGIFGWIQLSSDRWVLQVFSDPGAVGLYAVLFQVGISPLFLLGGVVSQLAAPIVYARAGDASDPMRLRGAYRVTAVLALGMIAATAVLSGIATLLHQQIFAVLAGPSFQSVSFLLPLAVLSGGAFNLGQLLCLVPLASGDSRSLLPPKIAIAILALALNVAGAVLNGLEGVVIAGLCAAVSYASWTAVIAFRFVRHV